MVTRATSRITRGRRSTTEPPEQPPGGPPQPDDDNDPPGGDPDDDPDHDDEPDDEEDPDDSVAADELTQAIKLLAKSVKRDREKESARVREPDPFDGNDSKQLRVFLVQCRLCFQAKPSTFHSDSAKVNFALSYLKGTALEWFEPALFSDDEPDWLTDFSLFRDELLSNFGPHDAVGDAEDELESLKMRDNQRITKYATQFNRYAALVDWGPAALRHQFYKGLPPRIKDELARSDKPTTLSGLRTLAQSIDARYWARQGEISRENKSNNPGKKNPPNNDRKSDAKGESSKAAHNHNHDHSHSNSAKNAKSNKSANPASASSKKPNLSNKLGKDGKLTPEERKRRLENKLCLFCGGPGHQAKDCPKTTSSASKAKARIAAAEKSDCCKSEDSKN